MSSFSLNFIDILIIVISIGLVVLCGLWAGRGEAQKSARGYFLAEGRLPWYIIGTAFVSTSVSSEQIVGTVGMAYTKGMAIANAEWWSLPPYLLLVFIFIPIYLNNKISTVPEILTKRFGPICGDIYSWTMLVGYVVVFLVPVLYSGSLMFSDLLNIPMGYVLWITIILVAAYSVKGGLLSVMWTDALQCLMLLGGGLVLYFVSLRHIPGGWDAMVAASPERFHLYQPPSDKIAPFLGLCLGTLGVFMFYQATNQVMIQRVLGARSRWDGMMGITFAGFINLARPLVTCFLGFIIYHWTHVLGKDVPLSDQDMAFPYALKNFSPEWGLRGIVLAGFLAAVMSTISALANSTATLFALNVYNKFINKQATDKQLVSAGRIASVVSLIIAGLLAPYVKEMGGIFKYFQVGVTYLSTPFITVILVGLFWKRANYASGIFGIVGGLLIQVAVVVIMNSLNVEIYWVYNQSIAQVLIVIGMVIIARATPAPAIEQWQPFLWTPKLIRDLNVAEAGHAPRPWYQSIFLWFGLFAAIWIYLYWRYW